MVVVVIGWWWWRRCWRRGTVSGVKCMQKRKPAGVLYFHSLPSPNPPTPSCTPLSSRLYSMVFLPTSCYAGVFSDTQYSTLYTDRDTYTHIHFTFPWTDSADVLSCSFSLSPCLLVLLLFSVNPYLYYRLETASLTIRLFRIV